MLIVRAPLRISLCGGGTDLPEYYRNNHYGAVCSFAINKHVYIMAKHLPEEFPFRYKLSYSETELLPKLDDSWGIKHPILKQAILNSGIESLDFNSMADIPAGTGMGSSSAFTVATIHALSLLRGTLLSKEELAQAACKLEIEQLGEPIGKQDQYAAAYGGLNYIRFNADDSVQVQPLILEPKREREFLSHLRLFYLGKQDRSASHILAGQKKAGWELDTLKNQAAYAADILVNYGPRELGNLLHQAWAAKRELSPEISTTYIDNLYNTALEQGAWGGKLLGAGGSGFMLFCCPPDLKLDIGLKQLDFSIDYQGARSYYLGAE